jgi:2,4-dienoyl-CoA reductase-like NADH-dependent reductase (Old Yellow Enzyme family)/thioredoxin reductase
LITWKKVELLNMNEKGKYLKLFSPGFIGKLEIPNRIVMAPMATNYASETGGVTEALIDYYEARAKGGAGLVIVENCCVDYPIGKSGATQLRLDEDRFIPGISNLVDAVHHYGGKIAIQLNHAGPSSSPPGIASPPGTGDYESIGASNIPFASFLRAPRSLQGEEIDLIIEKFTQAAIRARKSNFDAIEIHGAHAYLLAHFMSPYTNHRIDEYGGDMQGRLLLPAKIVQRIRIVLGENYPIIFRISIDEFLDGGRGIDESKRMADLLVNMGVDAFHATAGTHPGTHPSGTHCVEPISYAQGWKVYLSEAIKETVHVPVIAVGVVREPHFAEEILSQGKADFVSLGRGLIADPEWPNKARRGQEKKIRKCISCNEGCIKRRAFMDLPIRCTVNAEVGRMSRFLACPIRGNPKRVLVIGGGPGGMEAARISKLRGHDVTLWEKKKVLGGQLVFAGVPCFKRKLHWFLEYLTHQMLELSIAYELDKEATPEDVLEFDPDEVILAAGAVPEYPLIPGIHAPNVKSIEEVLVDNYLDAGSKAIVMGGGAKGAETAIFLSERGKEVTIVEMSNEVAADMDPISRNDLLSKLDSFGVEILRGAKIISCEESGIRVVFQGSEKGFIEGDTVIMALGYRPLNQLEKDLQGLVPRIHSIGDCVKPRRIIDAVSEAYDIASQI